MVDDDASAAAGQHVISERAFHAVVAIDEHEIGSLFVEELMDSGAGGHILDESVVDPASGEKGAIGLQHGRFTDGIDGDGALKGRTDAPQPLAGEDEGSAPA
jgi:hypothetical protein